MDRIRAVMKRQPINKVLIPSTLPFKRPPNRHPRKQVLKFESLSILAKTTQDNLNEALQAMNDELKRLSGRVVISDHVCRDGSTNFSKKMSLNMNDIMNEVLEQMDSDSDESDSCKKIKKQE